MYMELLLEKLPRQIAMSHIRVPMFVPGFGTIPRYIVPKIIDEAVIEWTAICKCPLRVWHSFRMSSGHGYVCDIR
jgi:hypothetical protein